MMGTPRFLSRVLPFLIAAALLSTLLAAPVLTDAPTLDQNRKLHLSPTGAVFSPDQITGLQLWLKADAITGLSDGDPVTTWEDQSGNGNDAVQAMTANKPTYKVGIQNGLSVVRSDGTDDFMDLTGMTVPVGSLTFIAVISPPSTGTYKVLFDIQTGWFLIAPLASVVNKVGWYDTSWHAVADAATGFQILSWVLTAGGNGEIFRNGSSIGSDSYSQKAISGNIALFSKYDGSAWWSACDLGEFLVYNSALTPAQLDQLHRYFSNKWNISLAQVPRTDFYVRLTWPQLQAMSPLPFRWRVREGVN